MGTETLVRENTVDEAEDLHWLVPPQIVTNSWMLMMRYRPADPDELRKILPKELSPHQDGNVYIALYTVPDGNRTNGFGSYTLTYMGIEVDGHDGYVQNSPHGFPGRFFSHYFCNSDRVRRFVQDQFGLRTEHGVTEVEKIGDKVHAKLIVDGTELITASANVDQSKLVSAGGHFHYFSQDRAGNLYNSETSGSAEFDHRPVRRQIIPYVAEVAETTDAELVFNEGTRHPVKSLAPAEIVWAAWLRGSFAYTEAREI